MKFLCDEQRRERQQTEDAGIVDASRSRVRMKSYYLRRHEDVSGNSGCGRVAQVAEFDDGTAVLHWNRGASSSGVSSTEVFASVADLLKVHGHDGRSVLEPIGDQERAHGAQDGIRLPF